MSTQAEQPFFDDTSLQEHLPKIHGEAIKELRKTLFSFFLFHLSSLSLLALEAVLFFSLLPFFFHSTFLAIFLSVIFLSLFSYFILTLYFQTQKAEKCEEIKQTFLSSCRAETQHHLSIGAALSSLVLRLDESPTLGRSLPLFGRFAKGDLFRFKQLFLRTSLDELLEQIHQTPTDLEAHVSLANNYLAFARLYGKGREEQFCQASQLALEEFQILNDYAPNDPWVHEQLASGYRNLEMPKEEIAVMETLVKLRPQESGLLYRLGELYFDQGLHAKGLRIYDELKRMNYKKAEELISSYGNRKL